MTEPTTITSTFTGDVRRGSMKRVAAAVGEGSSAVASVHRALATERPAPTGVPARVGAP